MLTCLATFRTMLMIMFFFFRGGGGVGRHIFFGGPRKCSRRVHPPCSYLRDIID